MKTSNPTPSRSCWNTRLYGATAALLALSLLGVACGDADYVEEDENNSSVNNTTNNNNPPTDPCAALSPDACEADPRCEVQGISAPCVGDAECPAIAELVCVSVGCLADSDCPAGFGCVYDGTVTPSPAPGPDACDCSCAEGEDCLCTCNAPIAAVEVGYCAPRPDDGCQSDADCGPNQVCQPGFGVPCFCPPCDEGVDCAACDCGGGAADPAPPGICLDVYVNCWSDADCGSAQYCDWDTTGAPEPDIAPCNCVCEEGTDCDCACEAPAPEPGGICRDRNIGCSWDGDCAPNERCDFSGTSGGSDGDCACEPCAGESCAPCDCGGAVPAPAGLCVPNEGCGDGGEVFCDAEPPPCRDGIVVPQGGCWACVNPDTCEPIPFGDPCDDGTLLACDALEPTCPPNTISAIQDGCWACVDPDSCQPTNTTGSCGSLQDAITCSDSGCSWFECPSDVDCDNAGACSTYVPEERLDRATLTPDCAPNDGPAFRIAAGNNAIACGESPASEYTLEVYSWSYGANQLLPGASYSLESASIRYCGADGTCLEASSGVLYLGDAQNANAISGQLLFNVNDQRHLISFEALRCESLGFCG